MRGDKEIMDELTEFLRSRKKMNLLIVAANVIVFILFTVIGSTENTMFMLAHGASYTPFVMEGEYYRLFTAMFLHFGLQHMVYNMFCLIFMGDMVETIIGPVKYLIIYLLSGLAGNVFSCWMEYNRGSGYAVSAGASGAIFGMMGAMLYIAVRNRKRIGEAFGQRLMVMLALSVLQGFLDKGTNNWAHIGGLVAGLVLAVILYHPKYDPRQRYFGHFG